MNYALIQDGKVVNIAVAEGAEALEGNWVATSVAGIGWTYIDGNFAPPVVTEAEPTVPHSVTRRQARQALLLAGMLDQVEPAIASISDPIQRGMAAIEWADSQAFERDRPLLIQLGAALGLDSAALDNLFIQASKL